MKEAIIILGAGLMQEPPIKTAKELGYQTIVLDGSKDAPCVSMADKFEQIDLKDKESIESYARSLQGKYSRIGIMTAGTDFSTSVAWTAEKLGLPGIPYEAALNASDKSKMRERFKKANLPSVDFITITAGGDQKAGFNVQGGGLLYESISYNINAESADGKTAALFPLVIKPVDNMGGRGCRRVDNMEEFRKAASSALSFSRTGRAIAEVYMDGPEFSVDAIVYHDNIIICGLADRHIFFPPYFIEMGHTMPAVIEAEKHEVILDTFRAGVRALGITGKDNVGAAKGDIKLSVNKQGVLSPMIGEIAARLSGGYMSGWTYPYASGAQPIKAAVLMAMGRKPDGIKPVKHWTCAERAFISIPGTVKKIKENNGNNYVNNVFYRIKNGDKVDFPQNNVSKCGNIITSAPDRETAVNAAETAAKLILIHLDSKDKETGEFLAKEPLDAQRRKGEENFTFPPNAFELSDDMLEALNLLPEIPHPNQRAASIIYINDFPAFTNSTLKDYMGRTVEENLQAIQKLINLPLSLISEAPKNAENIESAIVLGRSFWKAFIRGAYQGAVYYIENLGKNEKESHSIL